MRKDCFFCNKQFKLWIIEPLAYLFGVLAIEASYNLILLMLPLEFCCPLIFSLMVSTAFLSPSGSSDAQSHLHIISESYGENANGQILLKQTHNNAVGDPTKKENVTLTSSYI